MGYHNYFGSDSNVMAGRTTNHRAIDLQPGFIPAASALFVPAASTSARLMAYILDGIVVLGLFASMAVMGHEGIGLWFLLSQTYFLVSELGFRKSLGKKLVGLEVVSDDLSRASNGQILGRALLRPIDELFLGAIALMSMVTSDENKRVGDRAAGTLVVQW